MPHRKVNGGKNDTCGRSSHEERLLLRVSSYVLAQDVLSSARFPSHVILTLQSTEDGGYLILSGSSVLANSCEYFSLGILVTVILKYTLKKKAGCDNSEYHTVVVWNCEEECSFKSIYFCAILKPGESLHKIQINAAAVSKIWMEVFLLKFLMQHVIHIPIAEVPFRAVLSRCTLYADKQLLEHEQRMPGFRKHCMSCHLYKRKLKKTTFTLVRQTRW